jgi:hypothetical protein
VIVDQWDALVAELATTPDVVDRLLAEHVPTTPGGVELAPVQDSGRR